MPNAHTDRSAKGPPPWHHLAAAASVVLAVTGLGMFARSVFQLSVLALSDFVALYMLAIAATALRYGRASAVLASALSVLAYDFVFVPPYWTLAVDDVQHVLTFATMFVVGLLISSLTERARAHEHEARSATLQVRTEQMRSSLLSAVSHDLRSPLATITGAATVLRDHASPLDATQRSELLEAICQESERMERLVANLLDMSRLESGHVQLCAEWVPVDELISSALARMESRLGVRDVRVMLAPGLALARVDPVLMEQVLVNLLENALKYSPDGSALECAAYEDAERLVVMISDRGVGLGSAEPQTLFDKFVRGVHPGVSGAGLGLAICKAIVEVHGGGIRAVSRQDGGATFEFWIPRIPGAPTWAMDAAQ